MIQLKYPIVLAHGLGARSQYGPLQYFHDIPRRLREAGNRVIVPSLTPWQSSPHRARELKLQIEAAFPEGKINIIGHSMGGLDARHLASRPDFVDRVASVTTIGTPNRGTPIADLALGLIPSPSAAVSGERLGPLLRRGLDKAGFSPEAVRQMATRFSGELPEYDLTDAPGVAYFSATSAIADPLFKNALPVFWPTHGLIRKVDGDNDGFVSVASATWGTHICTYSGDHYAQIGQLLGRTRGLDYVKFFTEILARLRREGF